jgi:hypothetical protein
MAVDDVADGTPGEVPEPVVAPPASGLVQSVRAVDPRPIHLPRPWHRIYTKVRADQLGNENEALGLPTKGGFVRSLLELEAEAERQSLIYGNRSRIYGSMYYIFGLPAAILAAIAGATALASTAGRVWAGIIALASSALSAAVVFLDSGKQRDRSAKTRAYWDDLYNAIHVARLTKMIDYTVQSGPAALNSFYMRSSDIRAGRDPDDGVSTSPPSSGSGAQQHEWLFPRERRQARPPADSDVAKGFAPS